MIAAGAEEARQDLELRRRYLAGELRDPTLESVLGSDVAGGLEIGARRQTGNANAADPPDLLDSGLAQFLGRRLQEDQRNSRLQSIDNPEPMTNLGPGLGNATFRGNQVWVETTGLNGEQVSVNPSGVDNQEGLEQRQGGPSVRPEQGRQTPAGGSARQ